MTNTGTIHFSGRDIGAELLPILTSGLYKDTLDALREYIQNAIDAEGTHIELRLDPDTVAIIDDGVGMTAEQARRCIRLGISDKNPTLNVGFRGIGVYSGFNLCNLLEIFTRSESEAKTYLVRFNFQRIRYQLLAEQHSRNTGMPPSLFLERVLEDTVTVETVEDSVMSRCGTRVILNGLLPEVYHDLNDWQRVTDYLQNVVPLPFDPDFKYGQELRSRFESADYRVVPLTLQIGERRQDIYRPYTNSLFKQGGLHPPKYLEVKGRQAYGFAWICINDARETLKDDKIRGLLIKKFGFSVADRHYLEPYFGRTVYNRRITGEVIVQHPELIPNAARSDFETNSTRQDFLAALPKLVQAIHVWANGIQETEKGQEVLKSIWTTLNEYNAELPRIQRDRERLLVLNAELPELQRRLKPHLKRLRTGDPEHLDVTLALMNEVQDFVKGRLLAQRAGRTKVERDVIRAAQRAAQAGSTNRDEPHKNVVELLDSFGLLDSSELRRVMEFIDGRILRTHLSQDNYDEMIEELSDYLEDQDR